MKIEEGKRYVRRDNTITPPLEHYGSNMRGFVVVEDTSNAYLYNNTEFGHMIFGKNGKEHPCDLIEEFKE